MDPRIFLTPDLTSDVASVFPGGWGLRMISEDRYKQGNTCGEWRQK